ncbi:MAG: hypothetical protein EOO77_34195 [Oxalobacteraceae bacterium]|nr:MAG: hypothetical protein EOO77_34195 [Oxalobacteraceae bacterium]
MPSPAPYAGNMTTSIIKLFSGGKRLKHFFDNIDKMMYDACYIEYFSGRSRYHEDLYDALREEFFIAPIFLYPMKGITIDARRGYHKLDGKPVVGYRVSAHVPFTGSKLLLQTPPEDGYHFGYRGRVNKTALHLHSVLPDMDGRSFAEGVQAELERIEGPLGAFRNRAIEYDDRVAEHLHRVIASF